MFGCCSFRQILASRSSFWKSNKKSRKLRSQITDLLYGSHYVTHSPLEVNFFVLIIFAANSKPVDFWTHRLTIENAPLWKQEKKVHKLVMVKNVFICWRFLVTKPCCQGQHFDPFFSCSSFDFNNQLLYNGHQLCIQLEVETFTLIAQKSKRKTRTEENIYLFKLS